SNALPRLTLLRPGRAHSVACPHTASVGLRLLPPREAEEGIGKTTNHFGMHRDGRGSLEEI
ncbi:MAG: hypothetical protein QOF48_2164, partial [Verrucomicrobiota bacterium]